LTGASAAGTTLYKRQTALNAVRDRLDVQELGSKDRVVVIDHTLVAGDGDASLIDNAGEINLCVLPPGVTIDLKRTYFKCSAALGDGTNLLIGYRRYQKPDGTYQSESANAICTFTDLGNSDTLTRHYFGTGESSITPGGDASPLGDVKLNSREPVIIFAKAANGTGTFDGDVGDRLTFQFGFRNE
jgi:hypothetical protein